MTESVTVFVIDDDASVRKGLTRLLRSAGYEIEAFDSADSFLARERYEGTGCIVLDLRMPVVSGIELQERLDSIDCTLPVIFLSGHAGIPDSVKAMKHGAVDFLTKPVDEDELLTAISTSLDLHRSRLVTETEVHAIRQRVDSLTARELETAQWLITGALNKQIADKLGITEKTVKVHRANIKQKMGAPSIAELVRLCSIAGIDPKSLQE